ncbi:unnamed protein product [Trichobilharzia szidati]|nr:unnamed protein product [Trichobilharzia szidati]
MEDNTTNNSNSLEIQKEESLSGNATAYGWIEDNNYLLSEEDIKAMFLEGCDELEGLSVQETSTALLASSWMDAELDTTRSRSRLWSRSKYETIEMDSAGDASDSSSEMKFELDEYCETELENDTMEDQEVNTMTSKDIQVHHESSRKIQTRGGTRDIDEKQSNTDLKGRKSFTLKNFSDSNQRNNKQTSLNDVKHDTVGISRYLLFCALHKVTPLRSVVNNLGKEKLSLQHRGLASLELKLITEALRYNNTVTWLDLSHNVLQSESLNSLAKVLKENTFIQTLVLSECKIRKDGLLELYDVFMKNVYIRNLDLSGCELGDSCCSMLAEILTMNRVLQYFNLSRNQISSDGAEQLGDAISSNDTLYDINLSWNSITGSGALCLTRGLKENIRIKTCDLSWNGILGKSALEIAQLIRENTSLNELYLQYNRISDAEIEAIGQALCVANDSAETKLTTLNISSNPISTKGVLNFFRQLNKAQYMKMERIMLEDIPVNLECINLIDSIKEKFPDLRITHGPQLIVGNTQDDIQSKGGTFVDLLFLLKCHINYNGKIFTDILQELDTDKRGAVSVTQFLEALKIIGVNYKRSQINELQQRLNRFADGTIYYKDYIKKQEDSPEVMSYESSFYSSKSSNY